MTRHGNTLADGQVNCTCLPDLELDSKIQRWAEATKDLGITNSDTVSRQGLVSIVLDVAVAVVVADRFYIALFSALEQTHSALAVCDSQ